MRLRGYDEETQEFTNDVEILSGEIANLTKTASKPSGISLFSNEAKTEYKSTIQLLREIAQIYDELDDKTQAQLLEKIGGKRQGQIIASVLGNWDTVENALVSMTNSMGSAEKEMSIITESIDFKINKFQETLVGIAQSSITTDFLKDIIDDGTQLLEVIEQGTPLIKTLLDVIGGGTSIVSGFVTNLGLIPTIFTAMSFKNIGVFKTFTDDVTGAKNQLGLFSRSFKQISSDMEKFSAVSGTAKGRIQGLFGSFDNNALKNFIRDLNKGSSNTQAFKNNMLDASDGAKATASQIITLRAKLNTLTNQWRAGTISAEEYNKQTNITKGQLFTLTGQINAATIAQKGLTIAVQIGKAALNALVGLGISLAITGIMELIHREEELTQKGKEAADKLNEQTKSLQEYADEITSLRKIYDNELGDLTEIGNAKKRLQEIQEDLIKTYGLEADGIDLVNGRLEEQIQNVKKIEKTQYEATRKLNDEAYRNAQKKISSSTLTIDIGQINALSGVNTGNLGQAQENIRKQLLDAGFDNLSKSGFSYFEGDIYTLDKMLETAYDNINKLRQEAIKNNNSEFETAYDKSLAYISNVRREWSQKTLEDNEAMYAQWLQYDSDYSEDYITLIRQQAKLENAIKTGNEEEIYNAKVEWQNAYNAVIEKANNAQDTDVSNYLEKTFGNVGIIENFTESVNTSSIAIKNLSTEITALSSRFDETFKKQNKLQSVFDKISQGTSLTGEEVKELAFMFPELADNFIKTSDGWSIAVDEIKKLNADLVDDTKESIEKEIEAREEYIKKVQNALNALKSGAPSNTFIGVDPAEIEKAEQEIQQLQLIMRLLGITTTETTEQQELFSEKIKGATNSISLLNTAMKEMNDDGEISLSTYSSLIEKGEDYADCVEIVNGKLIFSSEKFKELATSEYKKIIADLEAINSTNNLKLAEAGFSETQVKVIANNYAEAKSLYELAKAQNEVVENNKEIARLQKLIDEINNTDVETTATTVTDKSDPWKSAFESQLKEKKHLLAMDEITEEDYYNWLNQANKEYFENREKYIDEYRQYEEEYYKWEKSSAEKLDKEISDKAKKAYDDAIDNIDKKIKQLKANISDGVYSLDISDDSNIYAAYDKLIELNKKEIDKAQERIGYLILNGGYEANKTEIDKLYDYIADKYADNKEIEKTKLDESYKNEISYWENISNEVEKYYKSQIDNLKEINDATEKARKEEELRLNILEAEKKLADAQKNKNQLIFSNGQFSYEVDQEAVLNASENLKSANQSYTDYLTDEQINNLEKAQDKVLQWIKDLIEVLNNAKDGKQTQDSSNFDVINQALNSETGQEFLNNNPAFNQIWSIISNWGGNITEDNIQSFFNAAMGNGITVTKNKFNDTALKAMSAASKTSEAFNKMGEINNQITVGDITVQVVGDTAENMLIEFGNKLSDAIIDISSKLPFERT